MDQMQHSSWSSTDLEGLISVIKYSRLEITFVISSQNSLANSCQMFSPQKVRESRSSILLSVLRMGVGMKGNIGC